MEAFYGVRIAAATYAMYLILIVVIRIGKSQRPLRLASKLHLYGSLIYVLLYIINRPFNVTVLSAISLSQFYWGLMTYFILHYGYFVHIYGQISRGYSLDICTRLHETQRLHALSELHKDHFVRSLLLTSIGSIEQDRLGVLQQSGAIKEKSGRFSLTPYGGRIRQLHRFCLGLWNLRCLK